MQSIKLIIKHITHTERIRLFVAGSIFILSIIGVVALAIQTNGIMKPVRGGAYTEGIVGQPVMVNPVGVETQADKDLVALLYAPLSDLINTIDISPDGKQYAVKLKEDLLWSDGEQLTSDDVVFTIELIQKMGTDSPLYIEWQGIGVSRESELQTTITLSQPFTFFEKNIKTLRVIPKHIFASIPPKNLRLSSYNFEPIGSGPYMVHNIEKRKDGFITQYTLVENKKYAGNPPFIPDFSVKFFSTNEELIHEAELRTIQGFGIANFIPNSAFKLPRATMEVVTMPRQYALFFNQTNNPSLQDKDLRKALNIAINKERIVQDVLKEQGARIEGPLFRDIIGLEKIAPAYDPEDAARIIGSKGVIKLAIVVPEIPILELVAEKVREDWISAGVNEVTIYPLSLPDVQEIIRSRNYDVLLFGNNYKNVADMFPFWHSSFRFYPGTNLSLYKNPNVDKLLEEVRQTKEFNSLQIQQILNIDEQIRNDAPASFLFSMPYFYIHSTRMEGDFPEIIYEPSERFLNVSSWSINRVRVIGTTTTSTEPIK